MLLAWLIIISSLYLISSFIFICFMEQNSFEFANFTILQCISDFIVIISFANPYHFDIFVLSLQPRFEAMSHLDLKMWITYIHPPFLSQWSYKLRIKKFWMILKNFVKTSLSKLMPQHFKVPALTMKMYKLWLSFQTGIKLTCLKPLFTLFIYQLFTL